MGKQSGLAGTRFTATYNVNYDPGNLTAVGYGVKGEPVASRELASAGKPAGLLLLPDRSALSAGDTDDLAYVRVDAVDSRGVRCSEANFPISFSLVGSGASLEAVANGDPSDVQSVALRNVGLWRGSALAIVRPVQSQGGTDLVGDKVTLVAEGLGFRSELEIRLE